jgi:hypothetical protein
VSRLPEAEYFPAGNAVSRLHEENQRHTVLHNVRAFSFRSKQMRLKLPQVVGVEPVGG